MTSSISKEFSFALQYYTASKIVRKDLSKTKDIVGVQRFMKGLTTSSFSKLHSFNVEDSNKLDQFLAMLEMVVHDNP